MAGQRLHGTDGIRGQISTCSTGDSPIEKLIFKREISPELFAIIGRATGTVLRTNETGPHHPQPDNHAPLVIIGWDRRDGNQDLVDALESGLVADGCMVRRIGEVPTPGLHHCLLLLDADAGMMVTASHNPATDSGVKLFDRDGYKSMPELEDLISDKAWNDSESTTKAGEILEPFDGLSAYRRHLDNWVEMVSNILETTVELGRSASGGSLLLDCSGGVATDWLSETLTSLGIECSEVSTRDTPINKDCGAGGFNPTDHWTNEELVHGNHSHTLLQAVAERLNGDTAPWADGELVAAALDGDGDRCLLLEATLDGVRVVDGDQMAYEWLQARRMTGAEGLALAHSIESDLCLPAACSEIGVQSIQTAVGDRWLSAALAPPSDAPERLLWEKEMPPVCGCEDSGHIVLPVPHPNKADRWGLTGDGVATLLACVCARSALGKERKTLRRGWKSRVSVKGVDRNLWDGMNELSDEVTQLVANALPTATLHRADIAGETSLLLLEGSVDGERLSISIRNSGTEAKTSVTIKSGKSSFEELSLELSDLLRERLVP